jgi:hypothetical protein
MTIYLTSWCGLRFRSSMLTALVLPMLQRIRVNSKGHSGAARGERMV